MKKTENAATVSENVNATTMPADAAGVTMPAAEKADEAKRADIYKVGKVTINRSAVVRGHGHIFAEYGTLKLKFGRLRDAEYAAKLINDGDEDAAKAFAVRDDIRAACHKHTAKRSAATTLDAAKARVTKAEAAVKAAEEALMVARAEVAASKEALKRAEAAAEKEAAEKAAKKATKAAKKEVVNMLEGMSADDIAAVIAALNAKKAAK